jgi:hypothetical protein
MEERSEGYAVNERKHSEGYSMNGLILQQLSAGPRSKVTLDSQDLGEVLRVTGAFVATAGTNALLSAACRLNAEAV